MKKKALWLMIALVLFMGTARADWYEGTGPSKPYTGVPEVNLSEKIGYMMFYPSEGMPAAHACQHLMIYLPREDVVAGEGTLILFDADGREVWRTEMNSGEAVAQRSLTEGELDGLMWGGGTCFDIRLPRSLALGQTYFLNMTRGCVVSLDGVESLQAGGTDSWRFTVEGDFGVSGMAYRRPLEKGRYEEDLLTPQVGDEIRFDLTLGDAAMAVLFSNNQSVDFLQTMWTEDAEVVGTVTGPQPSWGVIFLDQQGQEMARVQFD